MMTQRRDLSAVADMFAPPIVTGASRRAPVNTPKNPNNPPPIQRLCRAPAHSPGPKPPNRSSPKPTVQELTIQDTSHPPSPKQPGLPGVDPAGCLPRTWTALLRLDRLRVRFRWSNRSQTVQPQPDSPAAARRSGCGGADSGRWGCLGRRRTQGQQSRCPTPRPRRRQHRRQPGPAWQRAGMAAAGLGWAGLGRAPGWAVGPVCRQRRPSRSDKGRPGRRPGGPGLPTTPGRQAGTWEPKCPEST